MDANEILAHGLASLRLRRYAAAIADADLLVEQAPSADAYILKARAHQGMEQLDQAREAVRVAIGLFPDEKERLLAHDAMALYRLRRGNEAIEVADTVLKVLPTDEWAAKAKAGSLRMHLHDLPSARRVVEEALNGSPTSAVLRAEYAAILFGSTPPDYDRALIEATKALEQDPLSEVALDTKTTLLIKRKDAVAAQTALVTALSQNEENVFVLNMLAHQTLEANGDAAEALRYAKDARRINPSSERACQIEIRSLSLLDQAAEAMKVATEVIAAYPNLLTPRLLLIDMLLADGDFVAAEKTLIAIEAAFRSVNAQVLSSRMALYGRRGELGRAINFGYQAVQKLPTSPSVRVRAASACAAMRRFKDAHKLLDEAPQDDSFIRVSRVLLHIIEGSFTQGLIEARRASKIYPESAQIQTLKAWLMGNEGDFEEAHRVIDDAVERLPLHELAHVVKLDVLLMQGDVAEAARLADTWRVRFADSHDFNVTAAQIYLQARREPKEGETSVETRIDEALEHIERVERMDRGSTIALQIKSMILQRMGRTADAMEIVETGLTRFPFSIGLLAQRGYLRYMAGDEDLAERDFLKAIANTPAAVLARTSLGRLSYSRRDYKRAQEHFGAVVAAQPHSIIARTNLAWSCTATGDPSDLARAEHECMKALDSDDKNARALGCRSAIAYHRKQRHTAEQLLTAAVTYDQDDVDLRVNLGGLQSRMGKYEAADQTLRDALAKEPDHVRCLVELSQLSAKNGNLSEARLFARRAIDSDPASPTGWRAMAGALAAEPNLVDAEKALRQALARVDDDESDTIRLDLARILTLSAGKDATDVRYREAFEHISIVRRRNASPEAQVLLAIAQMKTGAYADAETTLAGIPDSPSTRAHIQSLRQITRSYLQVERRVVEPRLRWALFALILANNVAVIALRAADQFDSAAFGVLLPLLLGLALLVVVLPQLTQFKIASVEAQLSIPTREHRHEIITGPALDLDMPPTAQLVTGTLSFDN